MTYKYECYVCGTKCNHVVGIAARRHYPNANGGPIDTESNDLDLQAFCGFKCMLKYYNGDGGRYGI